MEIMVDGKEQELTAVGKNGVELTEDLLGNYGALHYDEDHEIFTMSQEEFEWWEPIVEKLNKISELEDALTPEDKEKYYQTDLSDPDLGSEVDLRMSWLQEHVEHVSVEYIRYELCENIQEISYADREKIKKGCTRNEDSNQNPEITSFFRKEDALEALKDCKSEIQEMSSHGIIYFKVTEFHVEENVYDRDGDWIRGGDVLDFSEMPITELIKARPEIVSSIDISASGLEILAKDENEDPYIRQEVAANENTSVATLEALSKDADWGVRWNVAQNKNTPTAVLEHLTKDKEDDIRQMANERLENQHHISSSDLKEAKAEKDVRDAAAPKQEQKQKAQEQGLE